MTDPEAMAANALRASEFLKALANSNRLLILCHLAERERSVSELELLLKLRQPTWSQQLASTDARQVIELLYQLFCATDAEAAPARAGVE